MQWPCRAWGKTDPDFSFAHDAHYRITLLFAKIGFWDGNGAKSENTNKILTL